MSSPLNDPWRERRPRRFSMLVIVLAAFALGALLDRAGWLPGSPVPRGLEPTFAEAWRLVQQHYVDRQSVQPQRMTQGAIAGMVASLGDTGHSAYLTAEELKELETGIKGQMEGIGARVSYRDRRPTIMQTMPGSPARAAGLKPGDVILDVNGKPSDGLPLEQVVNMVRGPAGTDVHLTIQRSGRSTPLEFDITRAKVQVPDIAWHMLPDLPIAHLAIREFGSRADSQLRDALAEAKDQGAKALIVDLRGNPGGLKDQAVAVTSEFLTGGNVFLEQNAKGERAAVPVKQGGVAPSIPLTVLIDEGTASSAEIFAGAMQDHRRGPLVGRHTFGTGTVLEPFALSDGSAVLLAIAEWLTPNGRQFWHKGIPPDIEVKLPENAEVLMPETEDTLIAKQLAQSTDTQLLRALAVLKDKLGIPADQAPGQ